MAVAAARRDAGPRPLVLRPSPRPVHALLHRDVGALQLLRHAGAAHPVHDRAGRGRRAGLRRPATAGAVYGLYTSMVYMTSLPGGWIADRLIGQRRAVLYGGILIACGHFSMAVPVADDVLSGPDADRPRHRAAEGQRQPSSSASCTRRRSAPRRRLLDLLHGHQPRRLHRARWSAAISDSAIDWHLGFTRRRHRHGARPRAVRAGRQVPGRRRARPDARGVA